ncbi:hypothetical protein F5Y10DRAFT_292206 [Nemania abortiva]|nr:hypothetical protein F5Y10DRAFT_292206 [Nemania abortiva]
MCIPNRNYSYVGGGSVSVLLCPYSTYDWGNTSFINSANYSKKEGNDGITSSSQARIPPSEPMPTGRLWPSHKDHLNVYFMNGSDTEQSQVRRIVRKHYNSLPMRIRFVFLSRGQIDMSDIRVEFTDEDTSWSCIGTDAQFRWGQTTMGLKRHHRRSTEEKTDAITQASILHEFGHALGMRHAHQHPDLKADWDYETLMSHSKWSLKRVRKNYDHDAEGVRNEIWDLPYDPQSIMHYVIRDGDTHNRITMVEKNTVLSDGDKKMLLRRYPKKLEEKETKTGKKRTRGDETGQELLSGPTRKLKILKLSP